MKKKIVTALLILLSALCVACGKNDLDSNNSLNNSEKEAKEKSSDDIQKLLDDGKLSMEHEEYDIAADCFEQVLDSEPENLTARYSLEDIFKQTIKNKDLELSQDIYSYVANLKSKGDSLTKLQKIIQEYDENVLYAYQDDLSNAFFSNKGKGIEYISRVDMELNTFINAYDSNGFKTSFFESYGKSESEMDKDLVYYTEDGTLINNLEVHVVINEFSDGYLDILLYIADTKEVDSENPIHIMDYDENQIKTYSSSVGSVQNKDANVSNSSDNNDTSNVIENTSEDDELSKVKADVELCKKIKEGMEAAATAANAANEPSYVPPRKGDYGSIRAMYNPGGTIYITTFNEYLGVKHYTDLISEIQSTLGKKQGDINYYWVTDTEVVVYIDNTDINGSTKDMHSLSATNCQCIYAGPVELYERH